MDYFSCKKRIRLLLAKKSRRMNLEVIWTFLMVHLILVEKYKKGRVKKGRVLVLDAQIDGSDFLFINIYNANTEKEQVSVLNELTTILSYFENTLNHNVIFAGDFNIFFDASLNARGGKSTLKSRSINKLIELNEMFDLCDIWRNPKKRKYTFRQKNLSGIIQRRLDYIFISQNFQEYVKKSDVLNALSTDHSPVFCSISKRNELNKGKGRGLWKFNNSLISNTDFVKQMKQLIENIKQQQLSESGQTDQIKWELLKYEIRKFAITFSKKISQNTKRSQCELGKRLKQLESNLYSEANFNEYTKCKKDLELIYERRAEGVRLEANVNGVKKVKSELSFFLISKKKTIR